MPKATKKKPNPQDATLRNIRALKKEVAELKRVLAELARRVRALEKSRRR